MTAQNELRKPVAAMQDEGRAEAERFDHQLRHLEASERENRLAVLAWRPSQRMQDPDAADDSLRVVQLEARVSELEAYIRSVNESLPWRIIQRFRRLLGRAW